MTDFTLILIPVLALSMWLLYINGYLVVNSKRAVSFIGSDRGRKASFTACTGYIKRILRFSESRTLRMVFSPVLSKGSVAAELLDPSGQLLLRLDETSPSGELSVEKGKRYSLIIRFQSATGDYTLQLD